MSRILPFVRSIAAMALVLGFAVMATPAFAQSSPVAATPEASSVATPEPPLIDAPIMDANGKQVGSVHVTQDENGVTFLVLLDAGTLPEGEHGIHVHQTGSCSTSGDEAFASAGEHFNPTDQHHGAPNSESSHAGDLGNLIVASDGSANFMITVTTMTLNPDEETSLMDADGSALIIHADMDDLKTDPSGNSDGRVLCAVLAAGTSGTPVASPTGAEMPVASPVASPAA